MALQQISFPFGDEELPERPKDEDIKQVHRTRKDPDVPPLVQAELDAEWARSSEEQMFPDEYSHPGVQASPEAQVFPDEYSHSDELSSRRAHSSPEAQASDEPEPPATSTAPLAPPAAPPQPEPTNIPRISLAQARASIYYEEEIEEPAPQAAPVVADSDFATPVVADITPSETSIPEEAPALEELTEDFPETETPVEESPATEPTIEAEVPVIEAEVLAIEAEDLPLEIPHATADIPQPSIIQEEIIIASKAKTPKVKAPKTLPPAPGAETQLWPEEVEAHERASKSSLWPEEGSGRTSSSPKKIKIQKGGRGRKSMKELAASVDLVEIPDDDILFQKQYYSIGEVAAMFKVNTSLIRFWETEFTEIRPRKNKKGDRSFSPMDIKIIQLIHFLLRQKKLTIEGAKEYLKAHNKDGNAKLEMIRSMEKIKAFLLELKARL